MIGVVGKLVVVELVLLVLILVLAVENVDIDGVDVGLVISEAEVIPMLLEVAKISGMMKVVPVSKELEAIVAVDGVMLNSVELCCACDRVCVSEDNRVEVADWANSVVVSTTNVVWVTVICTMVVRGEAPVSSHALSMSADQLNDEDI